MPSDLGESYTIQSRYGKGQKALHFRPNSLTFFELMILAQVVHEFALQYSTLEKNCFWFCNMVFDACRVIFGQHSRDDDNPQLHHLEILGRWNGLKVNQTTKQELRVIVYKFKSTYSLGNTTGYPGVFPRNPHPCPSKPMPAVAGMGFHGHGSWVS